MTNVNRNYGLDFARCIAITSVFVYHTYSIIFLSTLPFVWYFAVAGVELFFALSGFLIGRILLDLFLTNNGELGFYCIIKFWIRRWLRTLPLYFFVYILLLVFSRKDSHTHSFTFRYLFFFQNFNTPPYDFFGESWSLCIEEWFYILFPISLFLVSFLLVLIKNKLLVFPLALILVILSINILRLFNLNIEKQDLIVIYRLDAIAYGVLAAYFSFRYPFLKAHSNKILWLSLLLIVFAALLKFKYTSLGILGLIYYPIAGLGFSSFVFGLNYYNWNNKFTIVTHISKISYSIYLTHLSLILYLLLNIFTPKTLTAKIAFMLFYTFIVWLVSIFTYYYIETPFIKWREIKVPKE